MPYFLSLFFSFRESILSFCQIQNSLTVETLLHTYQLQCSLSKFLIVLLSLICIFVYVIFFVFRLSVFVHVFCLSIFCILLMYFSQWAFRDSFYYSLESSTHIRFFYSLSLGPVSSSLICVSTVLFYSAFRTSDCCTMIFLLPHLVSWRRKPLLVVFLYLRFLV